METEKIPIVFAYWKDNQLMGFRADTFGTISMEYPKIYSYSREQVDIVLNNTRNTMNMVGRNLMKVLLNQGHVDESYVNHTTNTENIIRSWKEFELKVHPFIDHASAYDDVLRNIAINNLNPPIEVHKFQLASNEN